MGLQAPAVEEEMKGQPLSIEEVNLTQQDPAYCHILILTLAEGNAVNASDLASDESNK
jgi:hypothetical protein